MQDYALSDGLDENGLTVGPPFANLPADQHPMDVNTHATGYTITLEVTVEYVDSLREQYKDGELVVENQVSNVDLPKMVQLPISHSDLHAFYKKLIHLPIKKHAVGSAIHVSESPDIGISIGFSEELRYRVLEHHTDILASESNPEALVDLSIPTRQKHVDEFFSETD